MRKRLLEPGSVQELDAGHAAARYCMPLETAAARSARKVLTSLKGEFDSELRREGDAHGRAGTEEVPQRARGHAQLVEAGNRLRLGASRIQAQRRGIG